MNTSIVVVIDEMRECGGQVMSSESGYIFFRSHSNRQQKEG